MEKQEKAKILIIDDEPLNIQLLELILKKAGYTSVYSTDDARKATALYSEIYPDLILLDLQMPHMSGFEVLQELKKLERRSYLPIMVLTAETDEDSRLRALDLGAKDFLNKPFKETEVLLRIRNMLEVRLLHQQLRDQNSILEQKVKQRTLELRNSQLETIQRLGRVAEYRDTDTGLHIIRMSHYAERLARASGLSDTDCELILNASPMHDIGKVGIPDKILLKKGKLTSDEFDAMKAHTTIGGQMLANSKSRLSITARDIALTHHEYWDGSGYPKGLQGEAIPLFGRISALADVFDALTSARPYKLAWTTEASLAEINKQSGKQFDPELVSVFMEIAPDLLEIKEQYQE